MPSKSPKDTRVFPKPDRRPPQALGDLRSSILRSPAGLRSLQQRQRRAPGGPIKLPEPPGEGERGRPSENRERGACFRRDGRRLLGEGCRRAFQRARDPARSPLPDAHSVFTLFRGQQRAAPGLHRVSVGKHGVAGPHAAQLHPGLQLPLHRRPQHLQHRFPGCHRSQFEFPHGPALTAVVDARCGQAC